jgi:hypothetical protein
MISDKAHVGYFMYEGASQSWTLPKSSKGELVKVFKDAEEQKFFEQALNVNLNIYDPNNYFKRFTVKFVKNPMSMHTGVEFDLSDPLDNLRVRILRVCEDVGEGLQDKSKPGIRFVLIDPAQEEVKADNEMSLMEEAWTFWGTIKNSIPKMREFLEVYLISTRQMKEIPSDATKEFLTKEISTIIKDNKVKMLDLIKNPDYELLVLITNSIRVGAIEKQGVNKYHILGETTTWSLLELVNYLRGARDMQDDIYYKLMQQIKANKK